MAQEQNGIGTFTYEYPAGTASNRLVRIGKPFGQETVISYHPLGAPNAQALRLASIVNQAAGGTPVHSQFGYGFDASGRLTQWDRLLGGQTSNYTLENNLASELTGATETDATATILSRQSWHYDAAGNRLTASTGANTDTFTYNDANQLVQEGGAGITMIEGTIDEPGQVEINGEAARMRSVPGSTDWLFQKEVAVTPGTNSFTVEATDENSNTAPLATYEIEVSATTTSLTYDDNGNLLSDGTRTYTWDAKNRLLSVTDSGVTYSWKYDGLDRRVEYSVDGVLTSRWIWAGTEMIEERDATGQRATQWYTNGEIQNGTALVYNTDHLGSIRELVDSIGAVRARYNYGLWGERTKLSGDLDSRMGFTGHYTHFETGLVLALFRAYDSEFARWLSRDPISEGGGLNLYAYVGNSVSNYRDALGLDYHYSNGWYTFSVPRDLLAQLARTILVDQQDLVVNSPGLTGECATGQQVLAGSVGDDNRFYHMPKVADWRAGDRVQKSSNIAPGTVIATFDGEGRYVNADASAGAGNHAATYITHTDEYMLIMDQSVAAGRLQFKRLPFGSGSLDPRNVNDARNYCIVKSRSKRDPKLTPGYVQPVD